MPYPEDTLHGNEELVLNLHPHWWTITPSILTLGISIVLGIWALTWGSGSAASVGKGFFAVLVIVCLVWFGIRYVQLITTYFVLTSDRVIYRSGIVAKKGVEIPLDSVNAIHFEQKIWERMLGLGDLKVDSASIAGTSEFENVRHPDKVQNEIYIQMEHNENRKFDRVSQGINAHAAPAAGPSLAEQISQLGDLLAKGHITEAEFQAKKAELLNRM